MGKSSKKAKTIRKYLKRVTNEFLGQSEFTRVEAVLEPEDAGSSFELELVRAKFRVQKSSDVNAVGLIVIANADDVAPDIAPGVVAQAIVARLEMIEETQKGSVARLKYGTHELAEFTFKLGP
jgi:hypothetical protein